MIAKIKFVGVNSALEHLRDQVFDVSFLCRGGSMYEISVLEAETTFLFEIKDFAIHNHIQFQGFMHDGVNFGRAAIDIIK